jgi:hypothetical protein
VFSPERSSRQYRSALSNQFAAVEFAVSLSPGIKLCFLPSRQIFISLSGERPRLNNTVMSQE